MLLTTDLLDPDRQNTIQNIDQNLVDFLPKDYLHFLLEYGTGTYCDEVYITYPDDKNISLTFSSYTDLWKLNDLYNENDLLQSVQIGSTANGDIICVTQNKKGKIFVLPRHSMEIISFMAFDETIKYFVPKISKTYFDPIFDSKTECISLIKSEKELIDILPIHEEFLRTFTYDFVINETTQPKYFFKSFGGWITFDLIYKNGIYIKYQNRFIENILSILNFFKNY